MWSDTSAQQRAELGQREAGRPLTISVRATQRLPTSGSDPRHLCKGGGQVAEILGRPVPPSSVSRPGFAWKTSIPTLPACN